MLIGCGGTLIIGAGFDPMNQSNVGPAPPLEGKNEDTPEEKIKQLEKKVNELIEESCFANSRGELQLVNELYWYISQMNKVI